MYREGLFLAPYLASTLNNKPWDVFGPACFPPFLLLRKQGLAEQSHLYSKQYIVELWDQ